MNPCYLCNSLTSSVPLCAKEGLDFSYIALNSNCTEEDLRISVQNKDHIIPLIRQNEEYESAISLQLGVSVKDDEEIETAIAHARYKRETTALAMCIQRKEETLNAAIQERNRLLGLVNREASVLNCIAMKKRALGEVKEARLALFQELKRRRFAQAKRCFENVKFNCDEKRRDANIPVTGVSSIMNMPLPNNGYFEGVPIDTLLSGLCTLAHLVDSLSTCLNIPLPHPISPFDINGPTISPQYAECSPHNLLPVTVHLLREDYRSFSWKTLADLRKEAFSADMDSSVMINLNFQEALTLLQANIVSLCVKMDIPITTLWPAHCMLLNLNQIYKIVRDVGMKDVEYLYHTSNTTSFPDQETYNQLATLVSLECIQRGEERIHSRYKKHLENLQLVSKSHHLSNDVNRLDEHFRESDEDWDLVNDS